MSTIDELANLNISKRYKIFNMQLDMASRDLGIAIAGHKFYELSNLINFANYSIKQAYNIEATSLKSYFLHHAILDYNACYDYFEQIIYFAFDFFPEFYTRDEYLKILEYECRRDKNKNFARDIKLLITNDSEAKTFFDEYDKRRTFVKDKTFGIRQWANCIKHQGGFWFQENLYNQDFVKCMKDGKDIFSTEILLAHKVSHEDAFKRLIEQNKNIIKLANWLFSYIFEDTIQKDSLKRNKKFSANKNNFNKIKLDITYATEQ